MPEYFFVVAASSTAKYHSKTCLGKGGLVRHTQAAAIIAEDLFRVGQFSHFTERERDLVIVAILLHDGFKHGNPKQKYTVTEHPLIAAEWLKTEPSLQNIIPQEDVELISSLISTHMGRWNRDAKTKEEVLPVPETELQKFVHLADYMASRRYLNYELPNSELPAAATKTPLQARIEQVIEICKRKIGDQTSTRDELYAIIAKYNDGKMNPNCIKDAEVAEKILHELGALNG